MQSEKRPTQEVIKLKIPSKPIFIRKTRKVIREICERMDFNKRQTQELQLAINEALANIIQHAYENQPDHAIFIYFVLQPSRIEVIIRDFGKRPPMASHFKHRNLDQLHDRGLGLLFMKRCVDYMTYDFSEEGENQLKFIKYK